MGKNNNLRIGILAFHKALVDQPRDPTVVASYCLAIYSDISLSEAMEIAKSNTKQHNSNFQELSAQDKDIAGSKLSQQVMSLAESVKSAAKKMHDRDYLANAMSKYPQAPSSDMVTHCDHTTAAASTRDVLTGVVFSGVHVETIVGESAENVWKCEKEGRWRERCAKFRPQDKLQVSCSWRLSRDTSCFR